MVLKQDLRAVTGRDPGGVGVQARSLTILLVLGSVVVGRPGSVDAGDITRSLPLGYVFPARGGQAGRCETEIEVSRYRLFSSLAPSGQRAGEESVLLASVRLSMALTERVHLWLRPQVRRLRWSGGATGESESGFGDTWLGVRWVPPRSESLLRFGVAGAVLLPTGREVEGERTGDFTTGVADYAVIGLCDVDFSRYFEPHRCVVMVNVGYRWHRNEREPGYVWPDVYPSGLPGGDEASNDQLLLRLGWRYSASTVSLELEVRGDQFVHARDVISVGENPISFSAGVRKALGAHAWARLSGEVGLSSGDAGTDALAEPERAFPDWTVTASVGVAWQLWDDRSKSEKELNPLSHLAE